MSDKEEPKKDPEKKKPEKEKEEPTDDNWNESEFNKITDDGGVLKKILKDGIGSIPVEGNEVKINYEAKYQIIDQNDSYMSYSVAHSSFIYLFDKRGRFIKNVSNLTYSNVKTQIQDLLKNH